MPTPECKAENGHVIYNGRGGNVTAFGVDDVHAG